jgi:hypothetical protein
MKCIGVNCKCEATRQVEKQWLDKGIIGYCENHSPKWLKTLKVGEFSPNPFGTVGWYKRVS